MNSLIFSEMGLSPETVAALTAMGFEAATTVQSETIPAMMGGRDVIAKAPTGTGKTVAFSVSILEHLDYSDKRVQALILSPTRELAIQICDEMKKLAFGRKNVRFALLYGGTSMERQQKDLAAFPQIVVATPGRLIDHLQRKNLSISAVRTVVLDEADRMLDMGFIDDVTKILNRTPKTRQLAMMSATISREVMDISWVYQREPVEITVADILNDKPDIMQYSIRFPGNKTEDMLRIINDEKYSRIIIFANTKRMVQRLSDDLKKRGLKADCIHGDMGQGMRERAMTAFRKSKINILVATDVAARGIDVDDVDAVFNYDIPQESEHYLHRIGRTGRAGRHGVAYTFVSPGEEVRLKDIARHTKSDIQPMRFQHGKLISDGEATDGRTLKAVWKV